MTAWTRDSIEVLLNLGLELKGLQAAPGILEQAKARYPYIENISLFETASGRILYSTHADQVGKPTPHAWLSAQARATQATWHVDGEDPAVAGIRLDSSFLKGLGGIAIVYSTADAQAKMALMRERLMLTALAVFGAFALLAIILALLATRGMRRTLRGLADALDPSSERPVDTRLPEPLRAPIVAFREATTQAESRARRRRAGPRRRRTFQGEGGRTHLGCRRGGRRRAVSEAVAADDVARIRTRILLITLALVIAAATLLSLRTHRLFEAVLSPEITQKADTVAELATLDVERALGYGIPLDKVVGVPAYLDQILTTHAEIADAAVLDRDGRLVFAAGVDNVEDAPALAQRLKQPVSIFALGSIDREIVWDDAGQIVLSRAEGPDGNTAAVVAMVLDAGFIDRQFEELAQDVFIVLLVALFLAFEMAVVLLTGRTVRPLNQLIDAVEAGGKGNLHRRIAYRANDGIGRVVRHFNALVQGLNERYRRLVERSEGRGALRARVAAIGERFGLTDGPIDSFGIRASITDVRLPLFVFVMAEELQKSFLPLYIASLEANVSWLSPQLLISLPISIYMATLALATPIAGSWSDRYGPRRIFIAGLLVAIIGFVGAAAARSVLELIAARAAGAIGYGMCTIAAQGFIVQVTSRGERTQGISVFVTVLMSASICGTAIGGILADRAGYRVVFVCAAALALVAGLLALRLMGRTQGEEEGAASVSATCASRCAIRASSRWCCSPRSPTRSC